MRETLQDRRKPDITVSEIDYDRLLDLASSALARSPEVAEELLSELDRAKIVAATVVPVGVVRMGSTVEFESERGGRTRVTLVFPGEADVDKGRISIMTPIGTALLGLSAGQSIAWTTRDGRQYDLTVLSVEGPR